MDPYIRDQVALIKNRMVKNIELVGKYKIQGEYRGNFRLIDFDQGDQVVIFAGSLSLTSTYT